MLSSALDDLTSHFKDSGVFKMNNSAIRPRLHLHVNDVTIAVLFCAKIIANGLFVNIQL